MHTDLYAEIARLSKEGRAFVVATVIDTAGSTPQKPGTKMVVLSQETIGTVGGGAIELQITEHSRALLADAQATTRVIETHLTHELGMCCGGRMKVFLEKHGPAARLFVFGAGHVGRELANLAHHVGFSVTVEDERSELIRADRFTDGIERIERDPAEVAATLEGGSDTYFCVSTHDHPLDQAVLETLLRLPQPSAYLGVIGSLRKAERFKLRLRAAGFTEEQLARVESPMGVPIHALTPEEIAVYIVGRLIAVRRRDQPRR